MEEFLLLQPCSQFLTVCVCSSGLKVIVIFWCRKDSSGRWKLLVSETVVTCIPRGVYISASAFFYHLYWLFFSQVDGVSYLLQEIYGIENKYNTQDSKVKIECGDTGKLSRPNKVFVNKWKSKGLQSWQEGTSCFACWPLFPLLGMGGEWNWQSNGW